MLLLMAELSVLARMPAWFLVTVTVRRVVLRSSERIGALRCVRICALTTLVLGLF